MPPLPPLKDTLDAFAHAVLPAAGGAAVACAALLVLGRRFGALASAVAVLVGFACANFALDPSAQPTLENTARLLPWIPEAEAPGPHWLPRAALLLVLVGLVSRWFGLLAARALPERRWWIAEVLVWVPRIACTIVATGWLVRGNAAAAEEWALLRWQLAACTLALWVVLDSQSRTEAGAVVAALLGASLFAGAGVLLYSHNAKFMELAVIGGAALFGVATVSGAARAEGARALSTSGAVPFAALLLPGLVLGTRPSHAENLVPPACFWLAALAPLLLVPFLIPRLARQNRWLVLALRALLVLVPLAVALALANEYETLPFGEEEKW